jgi:hypothetical protein
MPPVPWSPTGRGCAFVLDPRLPLDLDVRREPRRGDHRQAPHVERGQISRRSRQPSAWPGSSSTCTSGSSDRSAYRHYWELCTLLGLRDGLRTGDVYVPGSRRYSDPAAYLLTPDKWSTQRVEFCQLVGKSADPAPRAGRRRGRVGRGAQGAGGSAGRRGRPGVPGRRRGSASFACTQQLRRVTTHSHTPSQAVTRNSSLGAPVLV